MTPPEIEQRQREYERIQDARHERLSREAVGIPRDVRDELKAAARISGVDDWRLLALVLIRNALKARRHIEILQPTDSLSIH